MSVLLVSGPEKLVEQVPCPAPFGYVSQTDFTLRANAVRAIYNSATAMGSQITACHYCLPETVLTNADLEERFTAKQLKSISRMSGIVERRVVSSGVTAADLGYVAAKRMLEARGEPLNDIGALIVTTQTGDYKIPASAFVIHKRLGLAERCMCFDINHGCSGFPYALSVAHGLISTGVTSKVLLVNTDAISTLLNPRDRGLVPLHGDGAVATLVEASEEPGGLGRFFFGSDSSGTAYLQVPAGGARTPSTPETRTEFEDESGSIRSAENLFMNGPAVFHFSIYKIPEMIGQALVEFQLTIDDLDLVILHQANRTMIAQIYKKLGVPEEKQHYFMETVGNLSGAATPAVLADAWREGKLKPGSKTLMASFGVGLSWGIAVVEWPASIPAAIDAPVDYSPDL